MIGSCLLSLVHSGRVVRALALARRCVVGGFVIRRAESIYRVRGIHGGSGLDPIKCRITTLQSPPLPSSSSWSLLQH